jgi:hypothetical protein
VREEVRGGDPALAARRLELLVDIPVLVAGPEALELARAFLSPGTLPRKAAGDAIHIALATVHACDNLLTWNCRHIANAELQRILRRVIEEQGYEMPVLCTPEELMGER